MKETPDQIAARLMAPASVSTLRTHSEVLALIIEAVREERGLQAPRQAREGKVG